MAKPTDLEIWVPETPGGTLLWELRDSTEAKAWANLLQDAAHMPYKTVENFKKRGYKVERYIVDTENVYGG